VAADDPFERRLVTGLRDLLDDETPPHPTWSVAPAALRPTGRPVLVAAPRRGAMWLLVAAVMAALVGSALLVAGGRPAVSPTVSPSLPLVVPPVSPSPSTAPSVSCSTEYALEGLPAVTQLTRLQTVGFGSSDGNDQVVFDFPSLARVSVTIQPASPPFVRDASGRPVTVGGSSFYRVTFRGVEGSSLPAAALDQVVRGPIIHEIVEIGDYEGVVTWILGLDAPACLDVSTPAGTGRVRVDLSRVP